MKSTLFPALLVTVALAAACSSARVDDGEDDSVPATSAPSASAGGGDTSGEGGGGGGDAEDACEPGAVDTCSVYVGEQNGVETCFPGVRRCDDDGTWGDCRMDRSADPEG